MVSAACIKGKTLVVEAQDQVGGYCRTTKRNGFVWDRAGHFFHFRDAQVKRFFQRKIPSDHFIKVQKKTGIHLDKVGMIDFPFQRNIHQLPKEEYIKCLTDLYLAEKNDHAYKSFKQFVYNTMGEGIADKFLVPYNEKLYACDLDDLDYNAMGRFFPKSSFEDILLNANDQNNASYNADFSYPFNGAEEFVDVINGYVNDSQECEVRLNTRVVSVDLEKKEAVLCDGEVIKYTALINTSPLNKFCQLAGIDTSNASLSANKVLVFNMGFDSKSDFDMQWVYYPGKETFYRVGAYHNILPSDRASLYVEVGAKSDDIVNEEELLADVLKDLKEAGVINSEMKLIDHEFVVMDPAYVHINEKGEAFKNQLQNNLAAQHVYSAGRYGNWTYCSIEDNMVEARDLAKNLVSAMNEDLGSKYSAVDIFED